MENEQSKSTSEPLPASTELVNQATSPPNAPTIYQSRPSNSSINTTLPSSAQQPVLLPNKADLKTLKKINWIFAIYCVVIAVTVPILTALGNRVDEDYTLWLLMPFGALLVGSPVLYIVNIIAFIRAAVMHRKVDRGYILSFFMIIAILMCYIGYVIHAHMNNDTRQISKVQAVQLIESCKIGEFFVEYTYSSTYQTTGKIARLNYIGQGIGPWTDYSNWNTLVTTAKQSSSRCGNVTDAFSGTGANYVIDQQ